MKLSYRYVMAIGLIWIGSIASSHAEKPNFVIIMADDMGYGDASCYDGWIDTPHLDAMASEGLRFTDFHSSGAVCSPTRAGLMTGRYQQRAGVPGVINADPSHPAHQWGLSKEEVTFSSVLSQNGYATGIFGKWHLGYEKQFNPVHHGFDEFRGFVSGNIDYQSHYDRMGTYDWWDGLEHIVEPGYSTHLITNHAVDFIKRNKDKPFCLYVAHEAIHSPWQTPDDPAVRGPDAKKIEKRETKPVVKRMMQELDNGVGDVISALKENGLEQKTLVFFFSDNGPAGGSAGELRGRKGSVWEGGHRVPAIAWWPKRIEPGVTDELAISLDLMPTMLSLADVVTPAGHEFDGLDLTALLFEGSSLGSRTMFWEHGNSFAVRKDHWKAVVLPKGQHLFDLSTDLGEKADLSQNQPDRMNEMLELLSRWKKEVTQ